MKNFGTIDLFGSHYLSTENSISIGIHRALGFAASLVWTDATPAAKTAVTGVKKETTVTFPAKAAATGGDYVAMMDADGALWGIALQKTVAVADVKTVTFPAKAGATAGDYIIIKDTAGTSWAVALNKKDVKTVTFPAKVGATAGDYIVVKDTAGTSWAISLNVAGTDPAPTGALWAAIDAGKKCHVDISGCTDAASVAAAVELAVDALTGFPAVIATDDAAANGTMLFTAAALGAVSNFVPKSADDSGVGSITVANTVVGGNTPTGALYTAVSAGKKAVCDISACSTAATVAAAVESTVNGLSGFTAVITTNDTANDGTMLFTAVATGPVSNFVPKNANDSGAGSITVANTTPGSAADAAPTGAIWTSIASGKKVFVDISLCTDASSVATAVETVFNALTGATTKMVSTKASGTIKFTREIPAVVVDDTVHNANDSGAGSITTVETTVGVASKFAPITDRITIASHGFTTGLKVALTIDSGSLPTGLSATNYYAIVVDSSTIKLASSYANAIVGTAVDFTDYGDQGKTATLTPASLSGSVKLQASIDNVNFFDISGKTANITTSSSTLFEVTGAYYHYVRAVYTHTAGVVTLTGKISFKEE